VAGIEDIRQRAWDFALTVITVVLLASLGVQSFLGTLWVFLEERSFSNWAQGPGYTSYVSFMNALAAPQVVALVVVMGLCVPKRLFSRRVLLGVSLAMVVAGIAAGLAVHSLPTGLSVYLGLAAAIQVAVVLMTVAGVRGPSYLTEGRLTKTGSGLLHLGFIVFGIVVVSLQNSSLMLPVFTISAVLVTGGTALSFYASRLAWHRSRPTAEVAFDAPAEEPAAESDAVDADEPGGDSSL
jgi:hypothetical protein